jgi:N-acylglucosamine-6-phosphate 2-epimerase
VTLLDRLRGGLIVSVQPPSGSILNTPSTVALLARCAEANGAAAVRIEGAERIAAARSAVGVPIVGLVKGRIEGDAPYITATTQAVDAIVSAGADIVAFDATDRPRAGGATLADIMAAIRRHGRVAFADCSDLEDGMRSTLEGAEIIGTTLAGYTAATRGRSLPALDLVGAFAAFHSFVVCEGGIAAPADARAARAAGASAVCVGTAITDVDTLVKRFASAAREDGLRF